MEHIPKIPGMQPRNSGDTFPKFHPLPPSNPNPAQGTEMLENRRVQSHFSIVFFGNFFPSKTRRNFNFFSIFQQNLHPARGIWEWPIPPDFSQFFSTLFPSIHLQGKGEGGFPKFLLGKSKKREKKAKNKRNQTQSSSSIPKNAKTWEKNLGKPNQIPK